jgi:hypothetical protein
MIYNLFPLKQLFITLKLITYGLMHHYNNAIFNHLTLIGQIVNPYTLHSHYENMSKNLPYQIIQHNLHHIHDYSNIHYTGFTPCEALSGGLSGNLGPWLLPFIGPLFLHSPPPRALPYTFNTGMTHTKGHT